MQATVLLTVGRTAARLEVLDGAKIIEKEDWVFPTQIGHDNAVDEAMTVFHDCYDYMNWRVHGQPGD